MLRNGPMLYRKFNSLIAVDLKIEICYNVLYNKIIGTFNDAFRRSLAYNHR